MTKLMDPDIAWPLTVVFMPCANTLKPDESSLEERAGGKVAVVVGGSQGLGFELASVLVREGANVALLSRKKAGLNSAREMLITEHFTSEAQMQFRERSLKVYECDGCNQASVDATIDAVLADFEKIDILINAAGIGKGFEPSCKSTVEDFRADFDQHFSGNVAPVLNVTNAVLEKAMIPAGEGQVINVSCKTGRDNVGVQELAVSAASLIATTFPCARE